MWGVRNDQIENEIHRRKFGRVSTALSFFLFSGFTIYLLKNDVSLFESKIPFLFTPVNSIQEFSLTKNGITSLKIMNEDRIYDPVSKKNCAHLHAKIKLDEADAETRALAVWSGPINLCDESHNCIQSTSKSFQWIHSPDINLHIDMNALKQEDPEAHRSMLKLGAIDSRKYSVSTACLQQNTSVRVAGTLEHNTLVNDVYIGTSSIEDFQKELKTYRAKVNKSDVGLTTGLRIFLGAACLMLFFFIINEFRLRKLTGRM